MSEYGIMPQIEFYEKFDLVECVDKRWDVLMMGNLIFTFHDLNNKFRRSMEFTKKE